MDIGRRIKEERESLGMSKAELARRLKVARNTVWRYEAGLAVPSISTLEKIARELRTTPSELLREPAVPAAAEEESAAPLVVAP
jgi:transcriptional regulator with XRE-family HTH domain